jgi:anti-sigma-K factor RskA
MGPGVFLEHLCALARTAEQAREQVVRLSHQFGFMETAEAVRADVERWQTDMRDLDARLAVAAPFCRDSPL